MRLFGLLLFVYGVNYVPLHLALETHVGNSPGSLQTESAQWGGLVAAGHEADSDHAPHLASDHSLRLASHAQLGYVITGFCLASVVVDVFPPQLTLPLFLRERQNPPGLPPPDPLQPRAPPLA